MKYLPPFNCFLNNLIVYFTIAIKFDKTIEIVLIIVHTKFKFPCFQVLLTIQYLCIYSRKRGCFETVKQSLAASSNLLYCQQI